MRTKDRRRVKTKILVKSILIVLLTVVIFFLFNKEYDYFIKRKVQAEIFKKGKSLTEIKEDNDKRRNKVIEGKQLNKNFNVIESGEKYIYDVEKIKNSIEKNKGNNKKNNEKKMVFLTFDDGPSVTVTPQMLNVLKQENVKATFFLIGKMIEGDEGSKRMVKKIFSEGHALANHSYSHDLKKLYPGNKINIEAFMNEINKTNQAIKKIVGQNFNTRVIRIPGGYISRKVYNDPNLKMFESELKRNNMYGIDWNAYGQDAEIKNKNSDEIFEAVKNSVGDKEKAVILMHDTYGKEDTVKALTRIIKYLKNKGYEFRTLK
ncbi:polysaccharide deacetylase family protein [Haloimpatiens sp. FM7330]|uniref:polysaccharide deacetylase family protein n=1 Tax=Haloimpatiens sp. FM7330 TaxID=3298610 RepID=UPI003631F91E